MFLDKKGHNYLKRLYQEEAGGYVAGCVTVEEKQDKDISEDPWGWGADVERLGY